MNIIMLVAAILFLTVNALGYYFSRARTLREKICNICIIAGISAAVIWTAQLISGEAFQPKTLIYSAVFAVCFVLSIVCRFAAQSTGPISGVSFIVLSALVLPTLAGILFWNEPFSITVGIGLGLLLIAFFLIVKRKKTVGKSYGLAWVIPAMVCFFCNGFISICIKIQQTNMEGQGVFSVLAGGFSLVFVLTLILYSVFPGTRNNIKNDLRTIKKNWYAPLLIAVGNVGANILVTLLMTRIDASVLFPITGGVPLFLITLIGILFLKEKASVPKIIGILLGICAIVLLSL